MVNTLLDNEGKPKYEGISPEATSGTAGNQPGVYRHETTGGELITPAGPGGVPHADAFVRLGFKWIAPVPTPQEIRDMQAAEIKKAKEAEPETKLSLSQLPELLKQVESLQARVAELSPPEPKEAELKVKSDKGNADVVVPDEAKSTKK